MKTKKRCMIFFFATMTLVLTTASIGLAASDYPSRPIELVIPYPPGGGAEFASKPFREKAEKILGQPIISIFKPGAGGATGSAFVAHSQPDGYTLLVGSNSPLVIAPLTKKGTGYTLDDFTPICNFSAAPLVWAVKEDSPYKTMQDFIQVARTKRMKYATLGAFTQAHINMEALGKAAGFQAVHIPYEGAAKAMTAAMGGHVDVAIANSSGGMVGPGKLRILAIANKERLEIYPDVPTIRELGYPIVGIAYFGLWGPKGIAKEVVSKIYEAHKRAVEESGQEIARFLKQLENTLLFLKPEELWEAYQDDYNFQKKTLAEMGVPLVK